MKAFLILIFLYVQTSIVIIAQGSNMDYERVKIGDAKNMISGLALSPDQTYLSISASQSYPFYKFDWNSKEVIGEFDVGNWYAGSSVNFSANGKYMLLQQLFYMDLAPNKDREVSFEIVYSNTGIVVKAFDNMHAVVIAPDESYAASLSGDRVTFWSLPDGKNLRTLKLESATNGLAISPDGKSLAVSIRLSGDEWIANFPSLKKNKKALKSTLKYKQAVAIYDVESLKRKYLVSEKYDIIYRLEYSPDGKFLFCLQIPHAKAATAANAERLTYLNTIDAESGKPLRKGFTSKAFFEPDFKLSPDGKLFGIVSKGARFLELHIYDFESGKMIQRFEQSYRLFEKNEGEMIAADGRMAFVFLPDNKTVVMTMGNHLIYWKLEI